jgi:hypothetical protein
VRQFELLVHRKSRGGRSKLVGRRGWVGHGSHLLAEVVEEVFGVVGTGGGVGEVGYRGGG